MEHLSFHRVTRLQHAGGDKFEIIGKFRTRIRACNRENDVDVLVASRDNINLWGLNSIDALDLWTLPLIDYRDSSKSANTHDNTANAVELVDQEVRDCTPIQDLQVITPQPHAKINMSRDNICNEFQSLFSDELGLCNKVEIKFKMIENAKPVQSRCRPIPYAAEPALEKELQRLESKGIIERVETSEWTTPIVMVKKPNGEVRVCADDKYLSLTSKIHSPKSMESSFSQLDLSDAYLQLAISEEHTEITTITTPKGLFKFKRLPFGIKTAPAIFQRAMDETLSGLDGILAYFDDILIMGPTMEEHDKALRKALKRLEERGFKLKRAKCKFAMEELKFLDF